MGKGQGWLGEEVAHAPALSKEPVDVIVKANGRLTIPYSLPSRCYTSTMMRKWQRGWMRADCGRRCKGLEIQPQLGGKDAKIGSAAAVLTYPPLNSNDLFDV